MNEPHDPKGTVDVPSAPGDSLDAGLAAAFRQFVLSLSSSPDGVVLELAGLPLACIIPPPKERIGADVRHFLALLECNHGCNIAGKTWGRRFSPKPTSQNGA